MFVLGFGGCRISAGFFGYVQEVVMIMYERGWKEFSVTPMFSANAKPPK